LALESTMMTEAQISRLAHSLNELRPDWPISSLTTWISRNLSRRAYQDAAVALVWVATDMKSDGTYASEKPSRVLEAGPWWRAAAAGEARGNHGPARVGEDCPKHPGQEPVPFCGPCATEAVRAYSDLEPVALDEAGRAEAAALVDEIRARREQRGVR
jgi:hypothetical protein